MRDSSSLTLLFLGGGRLKKLGDRKVPLVLYAAGLGRKTMQCALDRAAPLQVLGPRLGRDLSVRRLWKRVPEKGAVGGRARRSCCGPPFLVG